MQARPPGTCHWLQFNAGLSGQWDSTQVRRVHSVEKRRPPQRQQLMPLATRCGHKRRSLPHCRRRVSSGGALLSCDRIFFITLSSLYFKHIYRQIFFFQDSHYKDCMCHSSFNHINTLISTMNLPNTQAICHLILNILSTQKLHIYSIFLLLHFCKYYHSLSFIYLNNPAFGINNHFCYINLY